MMGQDDAITSLVTRGARIDLETSQGRTALIMAAISGDVIAVRTLVAAGADPNYENSKGYTALGWAAEMGKVESISALCDAGAQVDFESQEGMTALMHAAMMGRAESISMLVTCGGGGMGEVHSHPQSYRFKMSPLHTRYPVSKAPLTHHRMSDRLNRRVCTTAYHSVP